MNRILIPMRYLMIVFAFCLLGTYASAQISQGGKPIDFSKLKSASSRNIIDLPKIDNERLLKASIERQSENSLKPFQYGKIFKVEITPENSGGWSLVDDYRIWQVEIRSEGAKSLSLVFDKYYLPEGSRLFIFSADKADVIGAFTDLNNKTTKKLSTSPVIGDDIIVQYEEPLNAEFEGELSIYKVSHDFVGIKSLKSDRRPKGISGSCNVNVNCDIGDSHKLQANAVVRILIPREITSELCSGTLINNTNNDATPYVYTAAHCIENLTQADESTFLFNYDSPYCGEIDGDASRSLSGSTLKARADSLDFCLVEMSVQPPPIYRPYFLGWDRSGNFPNSTVCIHHPSGDVKKITVDIHSPKIQTYSKDFLKDGFWYIGNWEYGTTEEGSSGGALINQDGHMVGSLTGGAATCDDPTRDYFARFDLAWDYYSDNSKSLKHWLDPNNNSGMALDGLAPYSGPLMCGAFTNFRDEDEHKLIGITENGDFKGYWSGNNDYGFMNFAEKFEQDSSCDVAGVSLGVAKAMTLSSSSQSKINIQVYNGEFFPTELVYEQSYYLKDIDPGVMNYFEFNEVAKTSSKFFVSYELDMKQATDTFSVYMANRTVDPLNSYYIKDGAEWYTFPQKTNDSNGSALLMEVVLCNIDMELSNSQLKSQKLPLSAFPNPLSDGHILYLKFDDEVRPEKVEIYDLIGQQVPVKFEQLDSRWLQVDFSGNIPGTYLVRVLEQSKNYQTKILYLGN
ncbi:trypsin-like peptidase domain-containing protein [Sunxiuqinia sp. A32]|uniref:trypsin-like peptidase domain-containing protein n=1 Tax=Sunxiuqinia sp. A32 TaxID=3461496 RepID=UPI0040462C9A